MSIEQLQHNLSPRVPLTKKAPIFLGARTSLKLCFHARTNEPSQVVSFVLILSLCRSISPGTDTVLVLRVPTFLLLVRRGLRTKRIQALWE